MTRPAGVSLSSGIVPGMTFEQMWRELLPIGRNSTTGGYRRLPFHSAERECTAWYVEQASCRGLDLSWDGQGNAVAWWRPTTAVGRGVLCGSHLDSVTDGGAFDGPLGVIFAFATIDVLRAEGFQAARPLGIALFVEEEGSRFGLACLGSRLATGQLDPADAVELKDGDGIFLLDAMAATGLEPRLGPSAVLDDVECFVELHVEQGRDLVERGRPVAVASASWAHGRWRFDFTGEPNHAGATRMQGRHDPMLTYATTALAAAKQARLTDARATFGRIEVHPNVTNAIPSRVRAWLDARGPDAAAVDGLVSTITAQAVNRAKRDGTRLEVEAESVVPTVDFDQSMSRHLSRVLGEAPAIPTGAGHDAGILQLAGIPSAMLYVRNPTGVSHSPAEHADIADCLAGVEALAIAFRLLANELSPQGP